MSRLHTKEDVLDIVVKVPGLGYIEGSSLIAIQLNRISEKCITDILEYVESKCLSFEHSGNLILLPQKLAEPHILNILRHIQIKLKV